MRSLLTSAQCGRMQATPAHRWIDRRADWIELQSGLHRASGRLQPAAPIEVDFERERVLVLYQGRRPTPGYGLRLEQAERLSATGARVTLATLRPPPDAMLAQVLTSPCLVLALDAGLREVRLRDEQGERRIAAGAATGD